MTFEKGGMLHRVSYDWNPRWRGNRRPTKTGVCQLFWFTVFAVFIGWPILVVATRVFGWVVRIVGIVPMAILFGQRPAGPSWRINDVLDKQVAPPWDVLPFVDIERWPTWEGKRVMPGLILLYIGMGILFFGVIGMFTYWFVVEQITMKFVLGTAWGPWITAVVGILVLYFSIRARMKNSEVYQLVVAFARAMKARFCPIVEFK